MATITEVSFTSTINTGNYESKKVGAVASLDSSDDPLEVFANLVAAVHGMARENGIISTTRTAKHGRPQRRG